METPPTPSVQQPAAPGEHGFAPVPSILFALGIIACATVGAIALGLIFLIVMIFAAHHFRLDAVIADYRINGKAMLGQAVTGSTIFWVQGISDLGTAAFVLRFLPLVARRSLRELGLRMPSIRELGIGVLGTLAAFIASTVVGGIIEAITHAKPQEQIISLFEKLPAADIPVAVVTAVLIAPLAEELIFRGFLYNAVKHYLRAPAAIIVSSVLFAAAHGDLRLIPELGTAAIIFTCVYEYTGCMWANILCHALFNSIATIAIFVFHQTS